MNRSLITFYGGAGTVTGANFLLEIYHVSEGPRRGVKVESSLEGDAFSNGTVSRKILIDCGIHERETLSDPQNYNEFPYDPKSIDDLVVTHAHADHIGRVPKLVRDGFKGVIHSTPATKDLSTIMFEDALAIMSDDSKKQGGKEMLYEKEDVERALSLWRGHEYHELFSAGDTEIEFLDAGHILGSAMASFKRAGRTTVFTGDLGNSPEPLLNDTESVEKANYLVMESVYGDRVHEGRETRKERLRQAIEEIRLGKGILLIPSFSLERTQILLFELNEMVESGSMRKIPIYLDAPLAIRITEVYRKYSNLLNPAAREHFTKGDDPFSFPGLTLTVKVNESDAIRKMPNPKVIIAGAGMSHGGRIREHEREYLGDGNATILFVGYQAPGSLGRRIEDGEKRVEIDGERVRIRARIQSLTGYSGHRDRDGLLDFAANIKSIEKIFVTMGEPRSSLFLAQRLRDFVGIDAVVPESGQPFEIDL